MPKTWQKRCSGSPLRWASLPTTCFIFLTLSLTHKAVHPLLSVKYPLLYFQRTEEATDARTSGSVSPADFFTQTPKENSNFQIPVSCGKVPQNIYYLCLDINILSWLGWFLMMLWFFSRHWWINKPGTAGWKLWGRCGSVSERWPLCWSHPVVYQRRRGAAQENSAKVPKQAKEQHFNGKSEFNSLCFHRYNHRERKYLNCMFR